MLHVHSKSDPSQSAAGELEIEGTVARFIAGFPLDDAGLLREWVAIPNEPGCAADVIRLRFEHGETRIARISSRVEGLRLALGVPYRVLQPVLQKALEVTS